MEILEPRTPPCCPVLPTCQGVKRGEEWRLEIVRNTAFLGSRFWNTARVRNGVEMRSCNFGNDVLECDILSFFYLLVEKHHIVALSVVCLFMQHLHFSKNIRPAPLYAQLCNNIPPHLKLILNYDVIILHYINIYIFIYKNSMFTYLS